MAETNHSGDSRKRRERRGVGATIGRIFLTIGKVLGTLLLVGITTGAILACFASVYIKTVIMPQTQVNAANFELNLSSTIKYYDPVTGAEKELRTLHGGENRVWVAYKDIPENLIHAAVAIEDKRFYQHHGVDWWRTFGAFGNMFLGMKDNFGGSTLTQQLIKNITDQDDVTVKRKILEIFQALEFEKTHTKEEILEWYLNYIYLGESSYGVYTASYTYFGKNVSDLSLAECASLIGITNNPSKYDPYISETTRKENKKRQETILNEMATEENGFITTAQRDAALAEELHFQRGEDDTQPVTVYSWYEDQVIRDVIEDLRDTQHISKELATRLVLNGGLTIYSCYNPSVQAIVDSIYVDQENLPYQSASGQMMQSGIAIIDSATGNVTALSGGMGPKTGSLSFSRASGSKRPPGSSIKPLAVYSPAIELGMITPATVVDDSPFSIIGGGPWPVNSFAEYRGLTTVYEALQNSVNTVAVKIMANYITPDVAYDFVTEKYGLTLEPGRDINGERFSDKDVAPLALGGLTDGVSPLEMAAAFSTFPRNGTYIAPRTYTRVLANDGSVLIDNQPETHVAIKESTAWYITYMLKNAVLNGTGRKANFEGMEIAGKTGTTSSRKDLWFVGYTPYYTAAVWTGFDQQERMGSSLQNTATVMWNKVMSKIHENLEYKDFVVPEGVKAQLVTRSYCRDSGMIAGPYCGMDPRGNRVTSSTFVGNGDVPSQYCTVHSSVNICIDSPILDGDGAATGRYHIAGPFCPEESVKEVGVLDFVREGAAAMANVRDQGYLKSAYESAGLCTVHLTEAPPEPTVPSFTDIDPMDSSTWPDGTEYPNFNPFDQTTWPGYVPPVTPPVVPPATPPVVAPGTTPALPVDPSVTAPPTAVTPTPPPAEGPDPNEPFLPAA